LDLFVCFVVVVIVLIAFSFGLVEVSIALVERPSANDVLAGLVALEVCLLALAELVYVHGLREAVAGWRCAWSSVDAVWVWWGPGFAGI
jgi:hypothetical protein